MLALLFVFGFGFVFGFVLVFGFGFGFVAGVLEEALLRFIDDFVPLLAAIASSI